MDPLYLEQKRFLNFMMNVIRYIGYAARNALSLVRVSGWSIGCNRCHIFQILLLKNNSEYQRRYKAVRYDQSFDKLPN